MSNLALTAYVLVWPAIATIVLIVLSVSLIRDVRAAKRDGNDLI